MEIKKILDDNYKNYILITENEVILSDELSYQEFLSYHTALSASLLLVGIDVKYLRKSVALAVQSIKDYDAGVDDES